MFQPQVSSSVFFFVRVQSRTIQNQDDGERWLTTRKDSQYENMAAHPSPLAAWTFAFETVIAVRLAESAARCWFDATPA